jgi:hypothetical protein
MKKMTDIEQQQWRDYLSQESYNYAITITERDSDGAGSVYLSALQTLERIVAADPTAKAVIVISAAEQDHAHAHGVLKTSLPQRGVRSCSKGCWIHTQELYDAVGWYDYMLRQGASQATLTTEELHRKP